MLNKPDFGNLTELEMQALEERIQNGFYVTITDNGNDKYLDCEMEIRFDQITVSNSVKIRMDYQAHEKMFTDLVVSQLQYWS